MSANEKGGPRPPFPWLVTPGDQRANDGSETTLGRLVVAAGM